MHVSKTALIIVGWMLFVAVVFGLGIRHNQNRERVPPAYGELQGYVELRCAGGSPPDFSVFRPRGRAILVSSRVDGTGYWSFRAPVGSYDVMFSCDDGKTVGFTLHGLEVRNASAK